MIEVNGKGWDKLDDVAKISYCEELLEDVRRSREKRDLEWYLNYMFKEGNHYLTYNTTSNTLESNPPRSRGEVRMVVNKVRASTRAIQNYITRTQPKWEIIPGDIDEDTIVNARRIGKTMDYIYRKLHLESVVNGVVEQGMDTSVGWVEVDWDENAAKGLGQVRFRLHDSFDIWVDKRAYLNEGKLVSRFLIKTIKKSLDEIKSDEKYDKKSRMKVEEDEEPAVSRMKAKIIRRDFGAEEDVIKQSTVKECLLWDDERNGKGGNLQLFTYAGSQVLRDEELEDREYPLYVFQISMNPLRIYQRAWTSDAIPLNKALDRTVSQKIMYVNQALRFALIAEKGHGAGVATNEMGEILEVNPNRKFEQFQFKALPMGFDSLSGEMMSYIEDVLGAHDAALGRLPAGARSGKTLETLQAADANNLTGITQSLESFLSVVGEKVLDIISKKYVTSRIVEISEPEMDQEGKPAEFLRVIGEKGQLDQKEATIITGENEVIVKIGSWLGYTREAQRETLLRLGEMGILPTDEILRQFEFPNIEELSKKAREERLEQHALQAEIAGRTGQGGEGGIDMVQLADKENMAMANGNMMPSTEGATPEHSQGHRDFMGSRTFQELPDEIKQGMITHYQGEVGGVVG
jgi:hypothetical protein